MELIGFFLFLGILLYAGAVLIGGQIKGNAMLKWEWRQVKKFFKWIIGLFVKLFQAIHKSIKV